MDLEFHFFHGFLGEPQDWGPVIEYLNPKNTVICHNWFEDVPDLHPEKNLAFDSWSSNLESRFLAKPKKRVLVAYSLGGRLCLHLNAACYDALLLLASHPGLQEGKAERLDRDQQWVEKSKKLPQEEWMAEWNKQEVFLGDRNRPKREWDSSSFDKWMRCLENFSLGHQEDLRDKMKKQASKIFWVYGAQDKKFQKVGESLKSILDETHIEKIEDAGHGLLFDNPKGVAFWIQKVLNRVF